LILHTFIHTIVAATNRLVIDIPGSITAPYHNLFTDIILHINGAPETCFLFFPQGSSVIYISRKDSSNFGSSTIRFGLDSIITGLPGSTASVQLNYVTIGMSYV
jgi:hypothetical protein